MSDYPPPPPPPGYGPPPPPPGYGPPPPPPPPGYGGPPPPGKRNWLPWALGCGCGLLIVVALGVFGAIGYLSSRAERTAGSDSTRVSAADEKGTTLYTSSDASLNAELAPHYLPFSFRFPDDWRVMERGDSAGGKNFVKVERGENGFTAENFAVGYMSAPPGQERDPGLIEHLLAMFEQQFANQFTGFRRLGDDRMELGGHPATGFRFTATVQTEEHGQVEVFGRVLVVPVGGGKGLSIIMLGTPVGSGLQGVDDLGVKGGLPVILRTFRIGDSATSDTGDPDVPAGKPGFDPSGVPSDATPSEPVDKPKLKEIRTVGDDSAF